ncbi:hypothetical protein [Lacticaseibacillus sharpeae]|uniref:Uncharacterized protein n=1 Tax=Lacticaseibacillus sharpeae JCM 1186 = DSM 20505 TaxID=1291052 RepID=A0A0R1ZUY8_9LACO|nr:hypothetical protein [Lacticaseibacillus sharpeae]KRM54588.1 hypothetical protein FC18_GL000147 [Lacticaseibacillus sharpeae JCM 1186 = DSM 20505]
MDEVVEYKKKKVYFFHLSGGKQTHLESLKPKIIELYDDFYNRRYDNVPDLTINGERIFVSAMTRFETAAVQTENGPVMEFVYQLNIQRVDPSRDVEYGVLTQEVDERRHKLELADNEASEGNYGPLVNTEVLYDPYRKVLCRTRCTGDLSNALLLRFIKLAFNLRGAKMEVILNQRGVDAIDDFSALKTLRIAVASPNNFLDFADDGRSEYADMRFASSMRGNKYAYVLSGTNLEKHTLKRKLNSLMSEGENFSLETAVIEGENDGIFEPIDLLKNKLTYSGQIIIKNGEKITIKHYFRMLEYSFRDKLDFLKAQFEFVD